MEKFIEFMEISHPERDLPLRPERRRPPRLSPNLTDRCLPRRIAKSIKNFLEKNPGEADEIMATIHRFFSDNIHIQRGAAAFTKDGKLITQGKELQRATQRATKRNFGLTKEIGLHNMTEKEVKPCLNFAPV